MFDASLFNLDVHDFGALGDGVADDRAAIQAALDEAISSRRTLHFRPGRTYYIRAELVVSADVNIEGHNAQLGTFNDPMRSLIAIIGPAEVHANHLTLNACKVAQHALYCAGAGQSRFTRCTFMRARQDAVHLAAIGVGGGNDCMKFERCRFLHSGQVSFNGTVQVSAGTTPRITGDGTSFLTAGIRQGDFIHVGDEWLPVHSVDSETSITCALHPPSKGWSAGTSYTAHVGDGYREETFNDNNLVVHRDCLYRGNAGSGARFGGLYGPRVDNGQSDFNSAFGFVIGQATGSNVIGSSFHGCYTEDLGAKPFFLGYAAGITIDTLNCAGEPIAMSNPSFNWGTSSNVQGQMGAVRPIGSDPRNHIPTATVEVHKTLPPPLPNSSPSGTILFKRNPMPGDYIGWVKLGSGPYSDWVPFGKVELP